MILEFRRKGFIKSGQKKIRNSTIEVRVGGVQNKRKFQTSFIEIPLALNEEMLSHEFSISLLCFVNVVEVGYDNLQDRL